MSILTDHALTYVWAEPLQDFQYKIKPNRISPVGGFYKEGRVMWESIPMPNYSIPNDNRSFHIYPLGQLPSKRFALDMPNRTWVRADNLSMDSKNCIDVYADNGAIVPRSTFHLYQNYDGNLILAIDATPGLIGDEEITTVYDELIVAPYTLDRHGITIRFYKNAIIENKEWMESAPVKEQPLSEVSAYIKNAGEFNTFLSRVNQIKSKYAGVGGGNWFINGFLVEEQKAYTTSIAGTTITYQYDETIKAVRDFDILNIPGFSSIKDYRQSKYLLVSDKVNRLMDYHDDCDFYLISKSLTNKVKGVRLDVFGDAVVRQVTHTAWSVNQNAVLRLAREHNFLSQVELLTIRVIVRQGGMLREMGLQNNRINELYQMSNTQIVEAMVGVNSTVPEWRADELENSDYMALLSSRSEDITDKLVEDGYGYNALTRAVAKSNVKLINGGFKIDAGLSIPRLNRKPGNAVNDLSRTFTWYDVDGKYLGESANGSTSTNIQIPTAYPNAQKLEVMTGVCRTGTAENGTWTDTEVVTDVSYGYYGHRCYACNLINGEPDHKWVDITGSRFYTYVESDDGAAPQIIWNYGLLNAANYYPAVRFADSVNFYTPIFSEKTFTGMYEYGMSRIQEGRVVSYGVPPGRVDVFMNGELLIEGLDFHYRNSGNIYIVRLPTTEAADTKIVIRTYGYMNPKTNLPFKPRAVGFVKNGIVTINGKYDVYRDRDIAVIIGGKLIRPEDVQFAEDTLDESKPRYIDGMPYAICDYQALVEPFSEKSTIPYMMESIELDARVGTYLDTRLPDIASLNEYITPNRHMLYSPVMGVFTQMIVDGKLSDSMIDLEATDQTILNDYGRIAVLYQDVDPIIIGYDRDYVYVRPHALNYVPTITSKQYAFLERVNRIFLKEDLNLSGEYQIRKGT